jgi:predicted regulator of Ras-like GTPase activity (Roadblock/LC7/MglB family)
VDAGEALTELTRFSAEIEQAAIFERDGGVLASTPGADPERLRHVVTDLLEVADSIRPEAGVERVEISTSAGSVYAVRTDERVAVATARQPMVGALVVYDLRSCLARIDQPVRAAKKRRRKADVVDA